MYYIINRVFLTIIGIVFFSSLNIKWPWNTNKSAYDRTEIIEQVGEHCLYQDEIEAMLASISDPTVRMAVTNQYVRKWKLKYLIASEAAKYNHYDREEIEKKVQTYRNDLIVHDFLEKKIKERLNTQILDAELYAYYQQHLHEFCLQRDIVKGKFLSISLKSTRIINNIKSLFLSQKEEDAKQIAEYCIQYDGKCLLDVNKWLSLDEVIKIIGYNPPNKIQFLKNKKFAYIRGRQKFFFLKIDDYKLVKNIAPFEFIKEKIKLIILYKRQRDLIKNIEEEILQKNNDK